MYGNFTFLIKYLTIYVHSWKLKPTFATSRSAFTLIDPVFGARLHISCKTFAGLRVPNDQQRTQLMLSTYVPTRFRSKRRDLQRLLEFASSPGASLQFSIQRIMINKYFNSRHPRFAHRLLIRKSTPKKSDLRGLPIKYFDGLFFRFRFSSYPVFLWNTI